MSPTETAHAAAKAAWILWLCRRLTGFGLGGKAGFRTWLAAVAVCQRLPCSVTGPVGVLVMAMSPVGSVCSGRGGGRK